MKNIYITNVQIDSVRHLKNIQIPLSDEKKNLIITGKNGSGKTSLLDAISRYLDSVATNNDFDDCPESLKYNEQRLRELKKENNIQEINKYERYVEMRQNKMNETRNGLDISFNTDTPTIYKCFNNGEFVLAYYKANRIFQIEEVKNVEKINLNTKYSIEEKPSSKFVKYLVDLKVTQALALTNEKKKKQNKLEIGSHLWKII